MSRRLEVPEPSTIRVYEPLAQRTLEDGDATISIFSACLPYYSYACIRTGFLWSFRFQITVQWGVVVSFRDKQAMQQMRNSMRI